MRLEAVRLLVVAGLLTSACGDGPEAPVASPSTAPPTAAPPLAVLELVDPAADFRVDMAADFEGADDGQPLDEGNVVRTDDTGFALVEYLDDLGVARLDRNTTYEVVRLDASAEAPEVTVRLDVGRVWHNVDADAIDMFTVETAVATLAVRGTIWLTACPDATACTVAVVEGEVEVTPRGADPLLLEAGEQVTVVATGDDTAEAGSVEAATSTEPGADGFVDRNRALDVGADDPGPGEPAATEDPAVLTTIATICSIAEANVGVPVGEDVRWPIDPVTYAEWMEQGEAGPDFVAFGEPWRRGLASSRTAGAATGDPNRPWLQTDTLQAVLRDVMAACPAE